MKKQSFISAMLASAIAVALVLGFTLVACGGDDGNNNTPGGDGREPVTYSGTSGGATYTLTISPPESRAVIAGDTYELTIAQSGVTKKSNGTVKTVSQSTFSLQPAVGGSPSFTVTAGAAGITGITGDITLEDGTTASAPGTVSGGGSHTHSWAEWTVATPATCTTQGRETRVCTQDASHTETRTTAALGHDWGPWTVATPATCTTQGRETRVCTQDASHTETRTTAALGHDWSPWVEEYGTYNGHAYVMTVRTCRNDPSHKEDDGGPRWLD